MSQKQKIINAMLKGRVLTCLDGLKLCDSMNLRNRIVEIEREGKYAIKKGWKVTRSKKRIRTYAIEI